MQRPRTPARWPADHATACALLQREAVVVVDTLDELFDVAAILLRHPQPPAGGTAFVTGRAR